MLVLSDIIFGTRFDLPPEKFSTQVREYTSNAAEFMHELDGTSYKYYAERLILANHFAHNPDTTPDLKLFKEVREDLRWLSKQYPKGDLIMGNISEWHQNDWD